MEESSKPVSVRSVGMKYGSISALIYIVFFIALVLLGQDAFDNKWGWFRMVIGIVILVLAHKNFKDETDGFMSYGQGVGIGLWCSLTATFIGVIFTYLYINFIDTTVMDLFYQKQLEQMEAKGMAESQIEMAVGWTKKLFFPIYIFAGIFFGLLVALIVTIFTQKKLPEQAI
jgi:hypothetical protein